MTPRLAGGFSLAIALLSAPACGGMTLEIVDPPTGGVSVHTRGERVTVSWRISEGEHGRLVLDLRPGAALVETLGVAAAAEG